MTTAREEELRGQMPDLAARGGLVVTDFGEVIRISEVNKKLLLL
jgi:hypothetical protein